MFLDFTKAFDSVPHNEFLYTGPLWLFFKDYLQNRKHFVEVEGCKSDLLPVKSGVPQGSVLRPLLFLIYVNDILSLCSFSSVFLFADDAKLIASLNSASENLALQKDLDNLLSWCQSWKLSLNTSKCAYMNVFLSSSTNNNYTIGNDTIKTITPSDSFNVFNHITFHSGSTRSSSNRKLEIKFQCTSTTRHQYFHRISLLWNTFSPIDLSLSFTSIKRSLKQKNLGSIYCTL